MKQVLIERYGGPEVLALREVPRPRAGPGEVVVEVRCAGVNPKDVLIRKGKFAALTGRRMPLPLGHDLAGVVVEAAPGVDLAVGDEVYGWVEGRSGRSYAEYVNVPAAQVARRPPALSWAEAAGVPLAAQTALQAMRDLGGLRVGGRVVINGASGGVGTYAIQVARALGAHVTAVSSEANAALCRELGADAHVDYTRTDPRALAGPCDVFFDVYGNLAFDAVRRQLEPRGVYVSTVPGARIARDVARTAIPTPRAILRGCPRAKLVLVRSRRADLDALSALVERGELRTVLDSTYPLAAAAEAHRRVETRRVRGKVVLAVPG